MKYSWRTHEWKVGDRCVVRFIDGSGGPATVKSTYALYPESYTDLVVKLDGPNLPITVHRAECIPLRKKEKPKPREFWLHAKVGREYEVYTCEQYRSEGEPYPNQIHVREVLHPGIVVGMKPQVDPELLAVCKALEPPKGRK